MTEAGGLRERVIAAGFLIPTGVDGIYGRSGAFEAIVSGISGLVGAAGAADQPTIVRFPPILPRSDFERTDYLRSFPQLTGSIHTFTGGDKDHAVLLADLEAGREWAGSFRPGDAVLCPAACHAVYPTCPTPLPPGGRHFDVVGYCYRHEPSEDPARMQSFRMHEHVYLGDEKGAWSHRDGWVDRGIDLLARLDLPVQTEIANDPFFGRVGRLLSAAQKEDVLKIEVTTPIASSKPTAIMSANCHRDHFGVAFGLKTADGSVAQSACVGFGLERIALALLRVHGLEVLAWPRSVRRILGL